MKTQKNGNGVLIRRTAEPRKVRISFARNGKAKEVKIWMRWFTRIDPHFR